MRINKKDYLDSIHDLERRNFKVRELLKIFTSRPEITGQLMKKIERTIRACEEAQDALNEAYCGISAVKEITNHNTMGTKLILERRT